MSYVPAGLQSSCSEDGSDSTTGAQDKVVCLPQSGVEVDYFQFADQNTFNSAWQQLSYNPDQPYQPGDCQSSTSETGPVTINGNQVGELACPSSMSNPYSLVWDSTSNLIIAAIQAPSYEPGNLRIYWQGIANSIY